MALWTPATLSLTDFSQRNIDRRGLLRGMGITAAVTAAGLTLPGMPAIAAGLDAKGVQRGLWGLAYYNGAAHGADDPTVAEACKAFQKDRSLKATGQADDATIAELVAVVKHVQKRTGQTQDGWYGPGTEAGVKDFQRRWGGLEQNGRADAPTMKALEIPRTKGPDEGGGEEPPAGNDMGGAPNTEITRQQVLNRANVWVKNPRAYSMENSSIGPENDPNIRWRTDCSGFVSMALNIRHRDNPTGLTTVTLHPDAGYGLTEPISKEELKTGDLLIMRAQDSGSQFGHVVMFVDWANDSKTRYRLYEQAGSAGGTINRVTDFPYGNAGRGYHPFRYKKIRD